MMNALVVNNQVIEVSEETMKVLLQIAQTMGTMEAPQAHTEKTVSRTHESAKSELKVYDHVTEGFDNFVVIQEDNYVRFAHKDGSFLYEKTPRTILNNRAKSAGAVYDKDRKAWAFTTKSGKRSIKSAEKFALNQSAITADEINALRDSWTEKSAKRANRVK